MFEQVENIPGRTLRTTSDGSCTIYDESVHEHFHSLHGAWSESEHIFIDNALRLCPEDRIRVLEIGWGTGLNGLLTYLYAERTGIKIDYFSIEKYPLSRSLWQGYVGSLPQERHRVLLTALHACSWGEWTEISPCFSLFKCRMDALDLTPETVREVNVVYMDAFSPEKVPHLWTADMLGKLYSCSADRAILSTYCAKGRVRRMLGEVGYQVLRTPGPVGGKREILVAKKGFEK